MVSAAENMLRFFGATETANRMNPERADILRQRQMERENQARMQKVMQDPQVLGTLSKRIGLPVETVQQFASSQGGLGALGQLQQLTAPSDFEQQMQTIGALQNLPEEQRQLYQGIYGKGGTTVNVGGTESPFQEKFDENLGKGLADEVIQLGTEATDYLRQAASSEQALALLESNPNLEINPLSPLSNQVKSLVSPFLTEEQLKNVSDYQTLESQLIRNRFDVTKVLKGAITEQEQAAAQRVAGSATGTREGLTQTLKNNMAYGQLQADYNQRKAEYIKQMGQNYSSSEFEKYYKELGEKGLRPTLDSLISTGQQVQSGAKKLRFNPQSGRLE